MFWPEWLQPLPGLNLLIISSQMQFSFITIIPKYLDTSSEDKLDSLHVHALLPC
jgi:hypothetical protein